MKILLVEQDERLSATLRTLLATNRYTLDWAMDGQAGLDLAAMVEYDLILLDVQVPQGDGISVCRQLRARGYAAPILLLMADESDAVAVAGFEAGADDYVHRDCAAEVLLARMRTWLRRRDALVAKGLAQSATLTWGPLNLDLESGRAWVGEQAVPLTATEYSLLELFLRHPNRIFSRSAILDRLWKFDDAPSDRAIITHVKDLRRKLKAGGLTEDIIETIYGMGYRVKSHTPIPSATPEKPDEKTEPAQSRGHVENQAVVDKLLEQFRGVFDEQVTVLEQAQIALDAGQLTAALQQAARQEAHKLAGSLASFGYPEGSRLARSLEHWLIGDPDFSADAIAQFDQQVGALRQELSQSPVKSKTGPGLGLPAYRVLVIDDDVALTELLKAEAEGWGLRLKVTPNLAAARSRLKLSVPDVVLLDLSFPETQEDGLSLLQEITEQFPQLPVIVFTGRDSLSDRLAVLRLGARQFLPKPASPAQILQAIARVLPKPVAAEAKVLIVDDDPGMLTLLSTMLTPWGLEVGTLSEPQHFWQVLVATEPQLVLLDLEMPQISGLELCQVVRQDAQWGDLPILVVTAHTDAESLQQAFAAGADDFITKPVLGPELVTRVLSRIERTRRNRRGD